MVNHIISVNRQFLDFEEGIAATADLHTITGLTGGFIRSTKTFNFRVKFCS
jgi:hypothetical protein